MAKRAINWTEIEARYRCGEPPREIAKDYKDCTSAKISVKASKAGWVQEKGKRNQEKVESFVNSFYDNVKAKLDKLTADNIDVHIEFLGKLKNQMDDITNPFLTDGERTNSLFQTAMNNATKIMTEHLKVVQEEAAEQKAQRQVKNRDRVVVQFKRPEKRQ